MNEKIKELAKQARRYAWDNETHWSANAEREALFEEKFAELIIKECSQLLFAESERLYAYSSECDNMRYSDEADTAAEKCMDNILMIEQHFGVEE